MEKNKFDAILACRIGGTRLYGKPLQLIDIKNRVTILECLVKHIKQSKHISSICLAISEGKENNVFADFAEKRGWKYVFGDGVDVLGRMVKASDKFDTDTIFRITSECPFLYYERVDELYEKMIEGNYDYSMFSDLPEGSSFSLIKANALRISHKKGNSRHRSELVDSYIFDNKKDFKLNILMPAPKLRRPEVRITADYPEDLIFCRKVFIDLKGDKKLIKISNVIDYWDKNKDIRRPVEEIGVDWGHGRIWK